MRRFERRGRVHRDFCISASVSSDDMNAMLFKPNDGMNCLSGWDYRWAFETPVEAAHYYLHHLVAKRTEVRGSPGLLEGLRRTEWQCAGADECLMLFSTTNTFGGAPGTMFDALVRCGRVCAKLYLMVVSAVRQRQDDSVEQVLERSLVEARTQFAAMRALLARAVARTRAALERDEMGGGRTAPEGGHAPQRLNIKGANLAVVASLP